MAAPIAHIFLAVQMLAGPLQGIFDEKEFILGTSFPDIRYLKVVRRAETHYTNVTLQDILREKNSFKAGMLFHSFVDEQRELYVVEQGLYGKIKPFKFTSQSLKFAEDEILRPLFNISQYQSYFDHISPEEYNFAIEVEHIKAWHSFLQEYVGGCYTTKDLVMKYFDFNEPTAWRVKRWVFSWWYASAIEQAITQILHDEQARHAIVDFYVNFASRCSDDV